MAFLDETTARDEICRVGQSLFARGYVHATAGNISVLLVGVDVATVSSDWFVIG